MQFYLSIRCRTRLNEGKTSGAEPQDWTGQASEHVHTIITNWMSNGDTSNRIYRTCDNLIAPSRWAGDGRLALHPQASSFEHRSLSYCMLLVADQENKNVT